MTMKLQVKDYRRILILVAVFLAIATLAGIGITQAQQWDIVVMVGIWAVWIIGAISTLYILLERSEFGPQASSRRSLLHSLSRSLIWIVWLGGIVGAFWLLDAGARFRVRYAELNDIDGVSYNSGHWGILCLFLIHYGVLTMRRWTTRDARRVVLIMAVGLPVVIAVFISAWECIDSVSLNYEESLGRLLVVGFGSFVVVMAFRSLIAFSLPCGKLTAMPLFFQYYIFAMMFVYRTPILMVIMLVPIVGHYFPMHRNLREYWRPKRLPPLKRYGGMTLIELLIVIAILAILSTGLVHLTGTLHGAMERHDKVEQALALGRDQLALLRGAEVLPEPGEYPLDSILLEGNPLAETASMTITAGPVAGVKQVHVRVPVQPGLAHLDVELMALLGEGSPIQ